MMPIGQLCTCEPMKWPCFVFVQSVFVFVGRPSPWQNEAEARNARKAVADGTFIRMHTIAPTAAAAHSLGVPTATAPAAADDAHPHGC